MIWMARQSKRRKLADELGDLLLQVYLQAEVANQEDSFHLGDVYQLISEKLIRRHPHVFGDVEVSGAEHVVRNWEVIKREERKARGEEVAAESALRGIPRSAPALYQARELSKKAGKVGFRFRDTAEALAKVAEEARELAEAVEADRASGGATPTAEQQAELGDVLFALATLAHGLDIEPEVALEQANTRFRRRFERMEALARERGITLGTLQPDEWLTLWADAKSVAYEVTPDA